MKKEKTYHETRFSADVLSEAEKIFQNLSEDNEGKEQYCKFTIDKREARWTYDSLQEFLAEYRTSTGDAYFIIHNSVIDITLSIRDRSATLSVSAPSRDEIETIFELFEKNLDACSLKTQPKIFVNRSPALEIEGRIVTLEDVRRLAGIIVAEIAPSEREDIRFDFSAECEGGFDIKSGSTEILEKGSILANKRVNRIVITLREFDTQSRLEIAISHGNSKSQNYVSISGTDSKWISSSLQRIEEILVSFTPQNMMVHSYRRSIEFFLALGIGTLYFGGATSLFPSDASSEPSDFAISLAYFLGKIPFGYYLFKYGLAYFIGIFPAKFLHNKLASLWPSVELRIGPEHTHVEKLRRKWIASVFVLAIIPIAVSLISDFWSKF